MIDASGIGVQGMRDGVRCEKNVAWGMSMVVEQNYEVSMQAALAAQRARK